MASFGDYVADFGKQFNTAVEQPEVDWSHLSDGSRASILNMAAQAYAYDQNSVKNKLQQYVDAGLNPNLAYQQSPAEYKAPTMSSTGQSEKFQRIGNLLTSMQLINQGLNTVGNFMTNLQKFRLGEQNLWIGQQNIDSMKRFRFLFDTQNPEDGSFDNLYPGYDLQQISSGILYAPKGFPKGHENEFRTYWRPLGNDYYYNSGFLHNTSDLALVRQLQDLFTRPGMNDLLAGLRSGQISRQNFMNSRLDYQNDMLENLTPAQRTIFELFSELVTLISKFH